MNFDLINPSSRSLYTSALTPPEGFTFDSAVVTSFSAQLDFLLEAPVHIALTSTNSSEIKRDPLRIMDSVRRYSDRITVFYQRGRMLGPKNKNVLYSLLEPMCHEVTLPKGGVFHPKIWLIRFKSQSGTTEKSHIRFVVLSRNLTHDQSWDLILQLESFHQKKANKTNVPLINFIDTLLTLTLDQVDKERLDQIKTIRNELQYVDWNLPPHFENIKFHFPGIEGLDWKPVQSERGLIISPFCRQRAIEMLLKRIEEPVGLISRFDSFAELNTQLVNKFTQVYYLNPDLEEDKSDSREVGTDTHGLHAKVYILENKIGRRYNTHLLVGSANATNAALVQRSNIEVLVELIGNRHYTGGIDQILGKDSLGEYLLELNEETKPESDAVKDDLDKLFNEARHLITKANWELSFEENKTENRWHLKLEGTPNSINNSISIHAWPVTLEENRAINVNHLKDDEGIQWHNLALTHLTKFIAFRVSLQGTDQQLSLVLLVPSKYEFPSGREAAIIQSCIKDKNSFIRYLLFLLDDDESASGKLQTILHGDSTYGVGRSSMENLPVLEELVRISSRNPERLKDVRKLIEKLKESKESSSILSERFLKLWSAFE